MEDFIKNYLEESDIGYILEADVEYFNEIRELHNELPFLPERMEIEKCKNVCVICVIKRMYFTYAVKCKE